jgi:hypothetical protein
MRRPLGLWLAILRGAIRIGVSILALPFYGKAPDDRGSARKD